MRALVIGGAGYVGSALVRHGRSAGLNAVVFDNLSRGHRQALPQGVTIVEGDVRDAAALSLAMDLVKPDIVFHYAAYALVGESVALPTLYYDNNVCGMHSLLSVLCSQPKIPALVFSSTCAVFGTPERLPMAEDDAKHPQSPYGHSKAMCEQMIRDCCQAHGLRAMVLRYFNAAGADLDGAHGEDHVPETHLIPNILRAALSGSTFEFFGSDFATPDGTCIRDYIHVLDLADAHVKAAIWLLQAKSSTFEAVHLGSGRGYSNQEVLAVAEKVVGGPIAHRFGPRRPGDPAALFSATDKAKEMLHFQPRHSDLLTICQTAWSWHRSHPNGYSLESTGALS